MSITTKKINNENVDIVTCDNCLYSSTDIKRFIYFNVIGIYCTDCKPDWIDLVDIYNKKFDEWNKEFDIPKNSADELLRDIIQEYKYIPINIRTEVIEWLQDFIYDWEEIDS
tara:strand:- start:441 stop:776 length:336 start_codon:yes stop_codon:yes gene_type:complete